MPDSTALIAPSECLRGWADRHARQDANPHIVIVPPAHSDGEVEHLKDLGADMVIMGEREIARGIVEIMMAGEPRPPLAGEVEASAHRPGAGHPKRDRFRIF